MTLYLKKKKTIDIYFVSSSKNANIFFSLIEVNQTMMGNIDPGGTVFINRNLLNKKHKKKKIAIPALNQHERCFILVTYIIEQLVRDVASPPGLIESNFRYHLQKMRNYMCVCVCVCACVCVCVCVTVCACWGKITRIQLLVLVNCSSKFEMLNLSQA